MDPTAAILRLCETINARRFSPPGIFTNAIVERPEVTALIRDALPPEASLYKPNAAKDLVPPRVDGNSVYEDLDFSAWKAGRPAQAPKRVLLQPATGPLFDEMSSPTKRRIASQYNLIPQAVLDSSNVNDMCGAVAAVLGQFPSLVGAALRESVAAMQTEARELSASIDEMEAAVSAQRERLDVFNSSLNELLPRKGDFSPRKSQTIDDLIEFEEAEVRRLEAELELRSSEARS